MISFNYLTTLFVLNYLNNKIIAHLLNQLNHFPFGPSGASKIVSSVNETSDIGLSFDDLSPLLFEQSNIQVCFFLHIRLIQI